MTREEAKEIISRHHWAFASMDDEVIEAIECLAKESEDCISRQAVLDTLDTSDRFMDEDRTVDTYKALLKECYEVLPSVTPKQKMGHWILTDDDFVYCSECEDSYYPRPIDASWYYCPHCGAKMEESE